MVEEKIVCIGCPLGCRTTLRIGGRGEVLKVVGYKCNQGRQYVLEEYHNPVRILTATIRTEKCPRPLLPVRTNRPILKSKLKEATLALVRVKVKPPVKVGQVILPNLLNSGVDVVATDDLLPHPTLPLKGEGGVGVKECNI
jgi:CxxC motif-containing protein